MRRGTLVVLCYRYCGSWGNHKTDETSSSGIQLQLQLIPSKFHALACATTLPSPYGIHLVLLFPYAIMPHFTRTFQQVKLWQQEAGDGTFGCRPLVWLGCTCDRLDRDLCWAVSISLKSCMWPIGCTFVSIGCGAC